MKDKVLKDLQNNIIAFLNSSYTNYKDYASKILFDEEYFDRLIEHTGKFTEDNKRDLWEILASVDCSKIDFIREMFKSLKDNDEIKKPEKYKNYNSWYRPVRDENNKITFYEFQVETKKFNFSGSIPRYQLEEWVANYSNRGAGMTASEVCLDTVWNTDQFRAILRTFGIYKSTPYTLHEAEENTLEELSNKLLNRKEIKVIKNAERRSAKEFENRYNQLVEENNKLKTLSGLIEDKLSSVTVNIDKKFNEYNAEDKDLIIWLSDWHIGARVDDPTNNNKSFGREEIIQRIHNLFYYLPKYNYNSVSLVVLGDMIDGFNGQTTRGGHQLPQNMGDDEQLSTYVDAINLCIRQTLIQINHHHLNLITIKGGNHDGFALGHLTYQIFKQYENEFVNTMLIESPMFGHFAIGKHTYVVSHGKDPYYCTKGLSLNVTDKDRGTYLSYLLKNNISPRTRKIHFVKGDLHQDNFQQVGHNIDVRTVASLFGASDYSDYNFSDCNAGTSYDIVSGDLVMRGMINV